MSLKERPFFDITALVASTEQHKLLDFLTTLHYGKEMDSTATNILYM